MDSHGHGDHQPANTFHLFPKLPIELRLMIWECTWPGPRIIEGVPCENEEGEEYSGAMTFRIKNSLSAMLEQDFGSRIMDEERSEECPPVALQVCHESRKHTLSQYHIVESIVGPFYVNPYCDILWLSSEVTEDPESLEDLMYYHERELNTFTTVLIEEEEWNFNTPAGYASKYLALLGGLQTILIVWGDFNYGDADELVIIDTKGFHAHADKVRAQHSELLKDHKCTAKSIQIMDNRGNFSEFNFFRSACTFLARQHVL